MPPPSKRGAPSAAQTRQPTSSPACDFRRLETAKLLEPLNPARQTFDEVKLKELIASIRELGVIEPIIVTPEGDKYRVHAGHRRLIAGRALQLDAFPCMVYKSKTGLAEALKSHENRIREDLNAGEEARYFHDLLESQCEGDVDKLCELVKSRRGYVEQRLLLFSGDERVYKALCDGVITIGVAEELNKIHESARRMMYLDAAMQGGASVRMVRDWRINGNMMDQLHPQLPGSTSGNVAQIQGEQEIDPTSCYLCHSSTDRHEMEILYVHRSCARVFERIPREEPKSTEGQS